MYHDALSTYLTPSFHCHQTPTLQIEPLRTKKEHVEIFAVISTELLQIRNQSSDKSPKTTISTIIMTHPCKLHKSIFKFSSQCHVFRSSSTSLKIPSTQSQLSATLQIVFVIFGFANFRWANIVFWFNAEGELKFIIWKSKIVGNESWYQKKSIYLRITNRTYIYIYIYFLSCIHNWSNFNYYNIEIFQNFLSEDVGHLNFYGYDPIFEFSKKKTFKIIEYHMVRLYAAYFWS